MASALTAGDCRELLAALTFAKRAVQDYRDYPSHDLKAERLAELDALALKLRSLRDEANRKESK
jgi:hypothetical protein